MFRLVLAIFLAALPASTAASKLQLPYDVELDPAGRIFVADGGRHQLLRWDARRRQLIVRKSGLGEPTCLTFDRRGNVYFSDVANGLVRRLSPSGTLSTVARLSRAAGVSVDPTGRYLAIASFTRGIVRVELASGRAETIAAIGDNGLTTPHGVAYAANGDLWIADTGGAVYRLRSGGPLEIVARVPAFRVVPLAGGGAYLISGGPSGGRVDRLAPDGTLTRVAGTGRLARHADGIPARRAGILPSDVAPLPGGRLLLTQTAPVPALRVIDRSGRISTLTR